MSGTTNAERARLIHNDKTKLMANAPDRASIIIIGVGVGSIRPLLNLTQHDGLSRKPRCAASIPDRTAFFLDFAGMLHCLGRQALRGLADGPASDTGLLRAPNRPADAPMGGNLYAQRRSLERIKRIPNALLLVHE
ncbi:MAG: hypothetical protein U1E70_17250 [Acetobacteraceae bacterium]